MVKYVPYNLYLVKLYLCFNAQAVEAYNDLISGSKH